MQERLSERPLEQRVVITGMGTAAPTPNGFTTEGFWGDLQNGRHGVRRIDHVIAGYEEVIKTRLGALLPPFDIAAMLQESGFNIQQPNIRKEKRKWHPTAQAQVWTGTQALRQACLLDNGSLRVDDKLAKRFGVYQGSGVAGSLKLVEIQQVLDGVGDERLSPFDILELLGGRIDEVPSMVFNAQAFNDTMYTECAAGLSSIDRAVDELRLGRADVVLAGGVEIAAHPVTIAAFEATKAVTAETDPERAPLMFTDPENKEIRSGLVLGEGAGSVVLETLEHALRRQKLGAEVVILAEVLGIGKSADAHHDTFPSKDGASRAVDNALADANLEAGELDDVFIEGHLTGTGADVTEFRLVESKFNRDQIVGFSGIKVDTGHTLGAAGTLGAITAVLAMRDRFVPGHRTMTDDNRAPETAGWPLMPGRGQEVKRIGEAIVHSFGFGGKNRVLILGPGEKS